MAVLVNGVSNATTTTNVGATVEHGVPVVVTDVLTLTTTWRAVRWSEGSRRKLVLQNQSAVVVEVGYGGTNTNSPGSVAATVASGQQFKELGGTTNAVWARTQSGTATVPVETTLAGI